MPRIAFVHDWLTGMRGGEKCLERFIRLYPDCEIYTLFHKPGSTSDLIESRPIHTSPLQHFPAWPRYYRHLLPLFPSAARWQIGACDLVISLSHCIAKSAVAPKGVPHASYCFTPMRYAWHMKDQYFRSGWSPVAWAREKVLARMRTWDRQTSHRVDDFIAISQTVAGRIRDCYDRDSSVIFPPVDTEFYQPVKVRREDFYLVVSALAPYKRVELAVSACQRLGRRLVVIGTGQNERKLRATSGDHVQWLGWQSNEAIRSYLQRCRALLFPGEEDFGIVPVEAQACGAPVIAFGRGGASETVIGEGTNRTGVFFREQSVEALADAIADFERIGDEINPSKCRENALNYSPERFDQAITNHVRKVLCAGDLTARHAA